MGNSKSADMTILRIVSDSPGLSLYQLTRKTGWNVGKVDGSVRRLVNAGKIFLVADERNGRKLSLVFPKEYWPTPVISVPKRLLRAGNPGWSDKASVYALDNSTIGISGEPLAQWRRIAQFSTDTPVESKGDRVLLTIPRSFIQFYHLDTHFFAKTINGDNILITVGGRIVDSKPYPS